METETEMFSPRQILNSVFISTSYLAKPYGRLTGSITLCLEVFCVAQTVIPLTETGKGNVN